MNVIICVSQFSTFSIFSQFFKKEKKHKKKSKRFCGCNEIDSVQLAELKDANDFFV